MAEPTVQVPVSLVERAADLLDKHYLGITGARLRALLSQSAPTAEPERTYTATDVQEAFERGCVRGEQDANERNCSRRQYEKMQASLPPVAPPSIADMASGTTFTAELTEYPLRPLRFTREVGWYVSVGSVDYAHTEVDPSTIRDVTPPTEGTK